MINNKIQLTHNTTITDPEGRFVITSISVHNNLLTIAHLYAPNKDDPSFFHKLFSLFNNFPSSELIIGGDFNSVLDPLIDRSSTAGNGRSCQSTVILKQYMEDYGLGNNWRLNHPAKENTPIFHKFIIHLPEMIFS